MRRTLCVTFALMLISTMCCVPFAFAQVNQQAIDDVTAGRIKEAKASWWGFDAADATECLQAAINSGVPTLIVENMGTPWIVEPITLVSNQEIIFEDGVEILAKRGSFKARNDSLFTANGLENITLRGYGAVMRMWRDDYDDPEQYERAEWRHVLQICGSTNINIYGLTLTESGGDGIYLGTGGGKTNTNIHIKDVVCDKNYRQGISVITAENLLIEDTVMSNTDGTAPRAGIDFEPNNANERLVNVVMRNCLSENNAGDGYVAYLPPMRASSEPVSMIFENCRAVGNRGNSARIVTGNGPEESVKGEVQFIDCVFESSNGPGFTLNNNAPEGLRLLLRNVSIIDVAQGSPAHSPIMLMTRQGATLDIGGVTFENVRIRDPLQRRPMHFTDMVGNIKPAEISGNMIIERDGQEVAVELTPEILAEWMPIINLPDIASFDIEGVDFTTVATERDASKFGIPGARLRRFANLVVYAIQGDEVVLQVRHGQVGRSRGAEATVIVSNQTGEEIARETLLFLEETEVRFIAPESGIFHVNAQLSHFLQFIGSSHPLNLSSQEKPIAFFGGGGQYYFYVPEDTDEFGVKVFGEGIGEAIKATLTNPAGEVVAEEDDVVQARMLMAPPTPGIWGLRLSRPTNLPMEDYYAELLGVPPFFAPSPDAVLMPVR